MVTFLWEQKDVLFYRLSIHSNMVNFPKEIDMLEKQQSGNVLQDKSTDLGTRCSQYKSPLFARIAKSTHL